MRTIGLGVDIVEVERVARLLEEHGERFLARCFTAAERAYADANPARRSEHLAARLAAKEAAFKALGTGWEGGVGWTDAEVVRAPSGQPSLALHGALATRARDMGVERVLLSLSHVRAYAMATALAQGR